MAYEAQQALSGIVQGIADVGVPYLQQRMLDRRQEKQRKTQLSQLTSILEEAFPGQEGKTGLLARAKMAGLNLSMEDLRPQADLSKFFSTMNAPEWMPQLYKDGVLDAKEAITMSLNMAGVRPETMTPEQAKLLYETGKEADLWKGTKIRGPETLMALGQVAQHFSKQMAQTLMEGVEQPEVDPMMGIFDKVEAGARSIDDFTPEERAVIHDRFKTKEQKDWLLGVKGDSYKLFGMAQKSIMNKGSLLFMGGLMFDHNLKLWRSGQLLPGPQREYFEKYYDSATGEPTIDAVMKEAEILQGALDELSDRLNITADEKGVLLDLMTLPPSKIDWYKVKLACGEQGALRVQKAYVQWLNSTGTKAGK